MRPLRLRTWVTGAGVQCEGAGRIANLENCAYFDQGGTMPFILAYAIDWPMCS